MSSLLPLFIPLILWQTQTSYPRYGLLFPLSTKTPENILLKEDKSLFQEIVHSKNTGLTPSRDLRFLKAMFRITIVLGIEKTPPPPPPPPPQHTHTLGKIPMYNILCSALYVQAPIWILCTGSHAPTELHTTQDQFHFNKCTSQCVANLLQIYSTDKVTNTTHFGASSLQHTLNPCLVKFCYCDKTNGSPMVSNTAEQQNKWIASQYILYQ